MRKVPLVFDPLAPDFATTASRHFANMRRDSPIFRHGSDRWQFISIFRYYDIKEVLSDPTLWSSNIPEVASLVLGDASILIQDDPPEHTLNRSYVFPSVTHRALEKIEEDIITLAQNLFRENRGIELDFVETIAASLSVSVICKLLGIPASEHNYLRDWTNRFSGNVGLEFLETDEDRLNDQRKRVSVLHLELTTYLRETRTTILSKHGDSLVHQLSQTNLTVSEQIGMLKSLVFAGNHSSTILQTNAAWLLAQYPEQRALVRAQTSLTNSAVEEILRYKGTFRGITRIASDDGELLGTSFRKGDYLIAWLTSGNWDESIFDEPERFDVMRSPNRHLSFGHGPHHCIGAHLARIELNAVVHSLVSGNKDIELVGNPTPIADPWVDGFANLRLTL